MYCLAVVVRSVLSDKKSLRPKTKSLQPDRQIVERLDRKTAQQANREIETFHKAEIKYKFNNRCCKATYKRTKASTTLCVHSDEAFGCQSLDHTKCIYAF